MFERELRDVAFIKRWSIVRTIRDQSVAEHSYFVAMYANDICTMLELPDSVKLGCLRKALWHDVDEIFTGDLPGPSKRKLLEQDFQARWKLILGNWTSKVFKRFLDRYTVQLEHQSQNGTIDLVVKLADWVDAAMEMATEAQMGNANCLPHMRSQLEKAIAAVDDLSLYLTGNQIEGLILDVEDPAFPFQRLAFAIRDGVDHAYSGQSMGPQIAKASL
jgi:5'-deoxynucleotidase YfbR-like HD superfamily hydrolase